MNDKDFSEVVACFKEAGQIKSVVEKPDGICEINPPAIKAVRTKLHLVQKDFAAMIGVSLSMLQSWEQGKSAPDGPAKALLTVAVKNPQAFMTALHP
jgi:putative transcriptional regulator